MKHAIEMILAALAGLLFCGCVASAILIIVVGQPFLNAITQLSWSLK
ncbi:hypothetical protein [Paraburkholderia unamae]|uniref:Uncharacterized protein n=1 Tax=Paraburkholderia unamae TaxID=219649 RepID=A0ABX5KG07_9BURK|nr:hypothetical protein [Paraburkholderia unamae]PVX77202.1 hypothetical protein C7402_115261 [Paraburkholderia unamae]